MFIRNAKRVVALSFLLIVIAGCRTSPQASEAKYLQRGDALVEKKDYARALLEFRNATSAKPKDAEPYYQMGLAYLGSGDVANAARAFRKAVDLNPMHSGAQLKVAELMTISPDQVLVREAIPG